MVNILLLTRLHSTTWPAQKIFKTAIRSEKIVCGANKCLGSLQSQRPKEHKENLETPQLRRSQAQSIWSILDLTCPTLGQLGKSIQAHVSYKILSPDSNGQAGKTYSSAGPETTTLSYKELLDNRVDSNVQPSRGLDVSMSPKPGNLQLVTVWPSYPKIHQRVTLLNGLLGCGRPCLLSYIKHRLGPASLNYVGLNIVPFRTYVDLPDMPYPKDKNGYTLIWDLGKEDRKTIQSLASEELQDVLKKLKIPFTVVKSWKKFKDDGKVYGAPLEVLVQRDIKTNRIDDANLLVPAVVKWMGDFIQLYGKTWDEVLKKNVNYRGIKEFQDGIERNFYKDPEQFKVANIYIMGHMGTCWKLLFLELPVPLMSSPEIEFFPEIYSFTVTEQVLILNLFILTMTQVHADTLAYVVTVLNELTKYPETKMDAMEFGRVFGPLLFKRFPADITVVEKEPKQRELDSVTRLMVFYCERMFVVPPNILNKLREINDKKQSKTTFPWSKKKVPEEKPEGRPKNLDIQVFDVASDKTETITIDGKTTVGDVLAIYHGRRPDEPKYLEQLKRRLQRMRKYVKLANDGGAGAEAMDKSFGMLHEVGGNIEERLLGFEVNMMDMLELNPNAKFEIRPKRQLFV
ncbi:unnamed protein product [Lymnaea stagnalis]|uniref:Rho-GAP domain-containing protein n=1 Tax=Lymnaea stagnalis TaxID=6523 RepID=A0AAV2IJD6_LYMST